MQANWRTFSLQQRSKSLEVYLLGLVDFDAALLLQERLVYETSGRNDRQGALLLCEHPPLITIGREGRCAHILSDAEELQSLQIDVQRVNRGGGCLLHAPGQLVVYPVLPLQRLALGLSAYREKLKQSTLAMCKELNVTPCTNVGRADISCRTGQFAQTGVAIKSWVSYHGLYINVATDPTLQNLVQQNATGERVTSLSAHMSKPTVMPLVRESMIRNLAAQLGYEKVHVYTGHPSLKRTTRKVLYALDEQTHH